MNIGALATATGTTTDTLRFYEREGLLDPPARSDNGYRVYPESAIARVRFVRGAQALGFTLAEIGVAVRRLGTGRLRRADIEGQLHRKIAEIDAQVRRLKALRKELLATFGQLTCEDPAEMRPAVPAARSPLPPVTSRRPAAGGRPVRATRARP